MSMTPASQTDTPTIRRRSPSEADKRIGAAVRARRISLGMSQGDLSSHLGLTFQQVQKYEKGTNRIGSGRLEMIAGHLGVPVSHFFQDTHDSPLDDAGRDLLTTRNGQRLCAAFKALPADAQSAFLQFAEKMAAIATNPR